MDVQSVVDELREWIDILETTEHKCAALRQIGSIITDAEFQITGDEVFLGTHEELKKMLVF